jgi:hypothetical protein
VTSPRADGKHATMSIYLTVEEMAVLDAMCKKEIRTASNMIRVLILRAAKDYGLTIEEKE